MRFSLALLAITSVFATAAMAAPSLQKNDMVHKVECGLCAFTDRKDWSSRGGPELAFANGSMLVYRSQGPVWRVL